MDDFEARVNDGRRVLYIYRDPAEPPAEFAHRRDLVRGWCFVVEDIDASGAATLVWDTWEDSFDKILRYPREYCVGPVVWKDRLSGERVDLDVSGQQKWRVADDQTHNQTTPVDDSPFVSRLAARLRRPIAVVGGVSAAVALGNLLNWVSDSLANQAAIAVGLLAASLFLCGVLDVRLHRAISALNARRTQRRSDESRLEWFSRVISAGLPFKDRLLFAIAVPLCGLSLFAGPVAQRTPAALLAFAGYFLVSMAYIALVVRDEPTDRYFPPFD